MFENHPFVSKKMLAVIMAAAVLLFVTGACMSISSGELSDILRSVADAIGTSEEDEQEQQAGEEDQAGEGEETAANEQGEQAESASSEDGNKQVGPPLPLELAVQYAVSQPLEKGTAACIAPAIAQAAVEGQVAVLQSVPPAISQPSTASDAVPGGGVAVSGEVSGFTTTQDSCSQYQNKIVFSRLDTSQPNAHSELYLVDPDGSNLVRIPVSQDYASDATVRDYQNPSWSPDRCRIAFTGHTLEGGSPNADIYTIKPDGTAILRLTNSPAAEQDPDWFPDGQILVYTSNQAYLPADPNKADLYTIQTDGSSPSVLLSTDSLVYEPQMFVDYKYAAYTWDLTSDTGEMVSSAWFMNIEKQEITRLTPEDNFHYRYPSWSRDGSKVALTTNSFMERFQLAVMKPDGSDIKHVVLNIEEDEVVRGVWSPDCQKMVVEIESAEAGEVFYDLLVLDLNSLETSWLTKTKTVEEVSADW